MKECETDVQWDLRAEEVDITLSSRPVGITFTRSETWVETYQGPNGV